MFENVLYQKATTQLIQAVQNNTLPQSLLFFGPTSSAKLTTALELARGISCKAEKKGDWLCTCTSCAQHKLLVHQNLLLLGPRDTSLEISASKTSFLEALKTNADYKEATRFLFLRSIRKQLLRYHPVLLENDDKVSKISQFTLEINELLEEIEKNDLEYKNTEKIVETLIDLTTKLEAQHAYDAIPVLQIRNLSYWARLTSSEGTKTVIIENADRMLDASKNALLKILEEPPKNTTFILLTANRNALLPTILSRLRPYHFSERNQDAQKEVIERVFHQEGNNIERFLLGFLSVPLETISKNASIFYEGIAGEKMLDFEVLVKNLGGLKSRLVISLFFNHLFLLEREKIRNTDSTKKAKVLEISQKNLLSIKKTYEHIRFLNQNSQAALESLARDLISNKNQVLLGESLF